jgi:hypothetical protein
MITTQHNTTINSELYKVLSTIQHREGEEIRWCYAESQMTAIGIGVLTNTYYHGFVIQNPMTDNGYEYGYIKIDHYKSKTHWI